jgi:hypothetical protein
MLCPSGTDPLDFLADYARRRREFDRHERQARPFVMLYELPALRHPSSSVVPTRRGPSREARRVVVVNRRSRASASSTASSSSGDPDLPPPPLKRVCRGCGCEFETREPRKRYCDPKCLSRTLTQRHRDKLRGQVQEETLLEREVLAVSAVRSGADPLGALTLLVNPPEHLESPGTRERPGRTARELCPAETAEAETTVRGRLFEVAGYQSRPMNGHREFHGSVLMREVVLP